MIADRLDKWTILLVEDHADSMEMLRLLLETLDYRVLLAKNGYEAITLAGSHQPDLVLTDYCLPDIDGIEVTRRLRRLGGDFSTVPIILFTAFDPEEYRQSSVAAGCTTLLTKPTDFEKLESIIGELLQNNCNPPQFRTSHK